MHKPVQTLIRHYPDIGCVGANTPENLGSELEAIRVKLGMSIRTFSERLRELVSSVHVTEAKYKNWEYGRTPNVPYPVMEAARFLASSFASQPMQLRPEQSGRVRVVGLTSAGDTWVDSPDDALVDVPIDFAQPDMQGTWVEGDSMLPVLHPRDIVIFKNWPQARANEIVVARLAKETADKFGYSNLWVVKQCAYNGERFVLRSFNERYPDIDGEFAIGGYLVGLIRDDEDGRLIRLNSSGLRLRNPA